MRCRAFCRHVAGQQSKNVESFSAIEQESQTGARCGRMDGAQCEGGWRLLILSRVLLLHQHRALAMRSAQLCCLKSKYDRCGFEKRR